MKSCYHLRRHPTVGDVTGTPATLFTTLISPVRIPPWWRCSTTARPAIPMTSAIPPIPRMTSLVSSATPGRGRCAWHSFKRRTRRLSAIESQRTKKRRWKRPPVRLTAKPLSAAFSQHSGCWPAHRGARVRLSHLLWLLPSATAPVPGGTLTCQ